MERALFVAVSLCIATATISNCQSDDVFQDEDKLILVIYSSSSDFDKNATATLNESAGLLAGNLKLEFYDLKSSGCDDQIIPILYVLIQKQIFHGSSSKVAGIVGPSCTNPAYAVAKLIKRSQTHLGHIHTSFMPAPLAANVQNTSWGLRAPADILANASLELVKHANWSQVLVLYQHSLTEMNQIFLLFKRQLKDWDYLKKNHSNNNSNCSSRGKVIVHTYPLQNVQINVSRILFAHSARILFLMLDADQARNVLCQAFMLKVYYPAYQWVIVKLSLNDLLSVEKVSIKTYVCDKLDILRVLKNALFVNFQTNVFISRHVNNQEESQSMLFLYEYSIQAMNTVLNNSGLFDTTYHLTNDGTTRFDYASLPIFPRDVSIEQIQKNKSVQVFFYSTLTSSLKNVSESIFLISSEFVIQIRRVYLPIVIILLVINFIILVVTIILQVLTFVFRQEQSVRSSSTILLHFCCVGIYMLNLVSDIHFIKSLFIFTSDRVYTVLCSLAIITGSIGLTLVLGTLAMKTWRLYRIFVHYMNPGKFLSNKTLIFLVCSLTLFDLVICISWFVFNPLKRVFVEDSRNNLEAVIIYRADCESKAYFSMFMPIVGYHAVIMAVILWLMCSTRKKIPKTHKILLSANSVMKLVYVLLFVFCLGITGNQVAYNLRLHLFEFIALALMFQSLQVSFVLLLLLPPVLPVLTKLLKKILM